MPAKKTTQKPAKKPSSKLSKSLTPSAKERAALIKGAQADMKKHGFKTVDELTAYYDSKRGY